MGLLLLHGIGHDLEVLKADGCQLVEPKNVFSALLVISGGDPCTTGCCYFNGGKCPAFLKHHSEPDEDRRRKKAELAKSFSDQSGLIGGRWAGMTSKQIREAEGISVGEFQKRKQAGAYKE